VRVLRSDLDDYLSEGSRLTKRSEARVAFEDAVGGAAKAVRSDDRGASVEALRRLSLAAAALADEFDEGRV
jgi:hypothetical protein